MPPGDSLKHGSAAVELAGKLRSIIASTGLTGVAMQIDRLSGRGGTDAEQKKDFEKIVMELRK